MIAGDNPDIPEIMDVGTARVHAPTDVIMVCGGRSNIDHATPPTSLRDAFLRIASRAPLNQFDIRLVESHVALPRDGYRDLLQLESHFSQMSALMVLFSESVGSFAELGVFASDDEISRSLLVVIDSHN